MVSNIFGWLCGLQFLMNLSLIFLVLIAFLAYLLYDMFKKSRQQQELAQAGQQSRPASRLKPSYQSECTILRQLHEQKINAAKTKQISIHLQEDIDTTGLTREVELQILSLLKTLLQHYQIYVLVNRKTQVKNELVKLLRRAGTIQIGFESNQGAVAILRQLSCGVHLQGNFTLYRLINQYLSAIWLAENGSQQGNPQFKSQLSMILGLQGFAKKTTKQTKEQ